MAAVALPRYRVWAVTFLGKYDQPLKLYVEREVRRARWQEERDAALELFAMGPAPALPLDEAMAAWEVEHPFDERLGDEEDERYWVTYRRCLTVHQRDWLRRLFCEEQEVAPGRWRYVTTKVFENNREATLMAILDWNIDGPDGVLPCGPHDPEKELATKPPTPSPLRLSWEILPPHIADIIQGVILNTEAEPAPAEDKRFPAGGGSGPAVQLQPAPDDHESVA
jgi:hypothetical protein